MSTSDILTFLADGLAPGLSVATDPGKIQKVPFVRLEPVSIDFGVDHHGRPMWSAVLYYDGIGCGAVTDPIPLLRSIYAVLDERYIVHGLEFRHEVKPPREVNSDQLVSRARVLFEDVSTLL